MNSKKCPIHPKYKGLRRPICKYNPKCICVDIFIEKNRRDAVKVAKKITSKVLRDTATAAIDSVPFFNQITWPVKNPRKVAVIRP